jgi:hypothetical protein
MAIGLLFTWCTIYGIFVGLQSPSDSSSGEDSSKKDGGKEEEEERDPPRDFTLEQLREFDGRIYVALRREVYDENKTNSKG